MSEEGKFKVSLTLSVSILISFVVGAFTLWTGVVQKYDSTINKIESVQTTLAEMKASEDRRIDEIAKRLDDNSLSLMDHSKRIDAQGQHILIDEAREQTYEGKIDTVVSLLSGLRNAPSPTPTPTPPPPLKAEH